ncbi:MAG: hypothetical protein JWM20_774 [Patescibacteria group bacterium]|nr:hypothetical protein [Patescibacteria group bacterium]
MEKYQKISLRGRAHFSADGKLESRMWNWWIKIDGFDRRNVPAIEFMGVTVQRGEEGLESIPGEEGIEFIKEMRSYLPKEFQGAVLVEGVLESKKGYISAPHHIPGDYWNISVPLADCTDPKAAEALIEKHFPKLWAFV